MADRFYASSIKEKGIQEIKGPEAHHLAVVSRVPKGARITLFSGNGWEYEAEVLEIRKNLVTLDVLSANLVSREPGIEVTALCALPKSHRGDFLIEKMVEIGVKRFVPLVCERSQYRIQQLNLDKIHRHVIEASKQCGRNKFMEIGDPIELENVLKQPLDSNSIHLIAHPGNQELRLASVPKCQKFKVLIGPEGGFSETEFQNAMQAGWQPTRLGESILRVETAAIVFCSGLILKY